MRIPLAALLSLALAVPAGAAIVEEIVAKVNDDIITKSELETEEQMLVSEIYRRFTGSELDEQLRVGRETLLQNLIDRKILLHRAETRLDMERLEEMLLDFFMEQQGIESIEELERMLAQEGITVEVWKKELVKIYAPQHMLDLDVGARIAVGEEEIERYYQEKQEEFLVPAEATVREIVLLAEAGEKEERRAAAEALRERAAAEGADFAELARKESEAGTAAEGGLLGPVGPGDLAEELDALAFALPVGDVSVLIEGEHGFHIIKVESRTEEHTRPLEEVREQLREFLEAKQRAREIQDYMTKVRDEAEVWVSPKYRDRFKLEN